jgi:hypothetical protein
VVLTIAMFDTRHTSRTLAGPYDSGRHALSSPLPAGIALLCLPYSHSAHTGRGSAKTGTCFFTAPKKDKRRTCALEEQEPAKATKQDKRRACALDVTRARVAACQIS